MFCLVVRNVTSLFSYPTPKENASDCNEAMPAVDILAGAVKFIAVPSAIKLKDEKHCRPRDPL
jgi:hypothetical protein